MFKRLYPLFILSSSFVFFSCKESPAALPESTGRLGSIVVVANADIHKALKPVYDSVFLEPHSHNPPFFEVLRPDVAEFEKFYFNQRLILVLVTEKDMAGMGELLESFKKEEMLEPMNDRMAPQFASRKDLFAKNQKIFYLFGKDAEDLKLKLMVPPGRAMEILTHAELEVQQSQLLGDTSAHDGYYNEMKKDAGVGVKVPGSFKLVNQTGNAYFFQMDTREGAEAKTLGLLVHSYPYTDSSDFSYASIRSKRDSLSKYMVKGEIPGTYMGTSESARYPVPVLEMTSLNGYKCAKLRAWWTIRGMSMSGPFIRYVVHVPSKNRIFAFEGFVYKPGFELRERDLRLIESIALNIQ